MKKILFFISIILSLLTSELFTQAGTLDSTFGADGKLTAAIGPGSEGVFSLALQQNGKILVAGYSHNGVDNDFALARYDLKGRPDSTFGTDGLLTTAVGESNDLATAVALQSDGKIIAAGWSSKDTDNDFALVRYHADGSLDASFDTDGKLFTAIGSGDDRIYAIAVQSDGKIIAAGYTAAGEDKDFALVRYHIDGRLDESFGRNGLVTTSLGSGDDRIYAIALQDDGKIVAAGRSENEVTGVDFTLARYQVDGSIDKHFGLNGIVKTALGVGTDLAHAIAIQEDGKIVAAGYSYEGTKAGFALARYLPDGNPDLSFNLEGKVRTEISSGNAFGRSIAIQGDGKIVVGGWSSNGVDDDFTLVRYEKDGRLDRTFGFQGELTTAIGQGDDQAYAVVVRPDGKIVAAGRSSNGVDNDFALVQYTGSNVVDVVDLAISDQSLLIYPNPVEENATLEYTLNQDSEVAIHLLDVQGQVVKVLINYKKQEEGKHEEEIALPEGLPAGSYYVMISSKGGRTSIKLIKL